MINRYEIRDLAAERRTYRSRIMISCAVVAVLMLVLTWRYLDLQIFQYDRFITESDRNRIHTQPLAPRRGLIFDRNGILLAENQPSFSLVITKERTNNLDQLLLELQQLFDIDVAAIKKFKQRRGTRYQAVPLKFKLNDDEIGRFAVNRHRLPGVEIEAQLVRHYPLNQYFSHVLGYVGRINVEEQAKIYADKERQINYAATNYLGKLGIEKFYEDVLHGEVGSQYVETNAHGRVLRVLDQFDPQPGQNLHLSLDANLQRHLSRAMEGRRGSIVVLDIESGDVLAMVSTPSYDPNLFVTGLSTADFAALRDSRDLPLFNRSLQGQYPPGSTIKPFMGLAGLYYRTIHGGTVVTDPGWYQLPNDDRYYRDWKKGGHGERINLQMAIAQSCDVYFYDLAFNLGVDRIHSFLKEFGLGEKTGIDSTGERAGLLPSREWKKRSRREPWFPGETLNIGIGQGYMLVTPLQLAVATATIANRGVLIKPRLVRSVPSLEDDLLPAEQGRSLPNSGIPASDEILTTHRSAGKLTAQVSSKHWRAIYQAMEDVVHSPKGTATVIGRHTRYRIAGKTGTAQVIGIAQGAEYDADAIAERQRDHALFIGFAPVNKPKIAVAVIVENGGSGSSTAAPIAKKAFDWVLNTEINKPQPRQNIQPWYADVLPDADWAILGGDRLAVKAES